MSVRGATRVVGLLVTIGAVISGCSTTGGSNSQVPSGSNPLPGPSPTPGPPLPVASPTVAGPSLTPIASFDAVIFSGAGSTSSAAGGITQYKWNFGDGAEASGVQAAHVFVLPGLETVTLTVTDANGASEPASVTVLIKDLTGVWQADFNVQTRTYSLVQNGKVVVGTYTNSLLPGEKWPVNGSIDDRRRVSLDASYPGESSISLSSATIDTAADSFTGRTYGGSASGQILTYTRQP